MSDAQPTGAESSSADPGAAAPGGDKTTLNGGGIVTGASGEQPTPRKGPLSFLSGAITSGLFAWGCLLLSERVVGYYGSHPPHYSARLAQSIATAVKTLVVGMTFLATFTFAFVGLGLFLVFVRSLFRPSPGEPT